MKRFLLVLATGIGLAVSGQGLAYSPLVYGTLNLAWENVEPRSSLGTVGGANQQEINSHQSRFGVRGFSHLYIVDVRAFYQLEYMVTPNDSASGLTNRESFLGVEGDLGTLQAGRFNTPVAELGRGVDQFSDYQWADIAGILRGQVRGRNLVQYSSPEFLDMLRFHIAGNTSEGDNVNDSGSANHGTLDAFSSSLVIEPGGGFHAGIGYDYNLFQSDVATDGAFTSDHFAPAAIETRRGDNNTVDLLRLVAGGEWGPLEFALLYQQTRANEKADASAPAAMQGERAGETSRMFSGAWRITERTRLLGQAVDTLMDNLELTDYRQWTLGAEHDLGERLTAYGYGTLREAEGVDREGDATAGRDLTVVSLGIDYRF